jgi:hypothetical protein
VVTPHKWALAAFQVLAVLGILACGVDAAVIRFVHRSLTPTLDDFFDAVSELANATILSIATLCTYGASRVLTLEHFPSDVLASAFIAAGCVRFLAPRLQSSLSRN